MTTSPAPARGRTPPPDLPGAARHAALLLTVVLAGAPGAAGAQAPTLAPGWSVSADLPPESRQFDFWVGEWDVNLRTLQDDLTWADAHQAVARVYPILRGKALLELWDSPRIKGYSLRYYSLAADRWVLWLNWPAPGRSGSSSLSGAFRHGRGDFFARRPTAEGDTLLVRYSFNDVTPTSLRWDDAYSRDGGRTWTHNWIMEFTRRADLPELDPGGGEAHTFAGGGRCEGEGFAALEPLAGRFEGRVEDLAAGDPEGPGAMRGYQVLGGCAVLLFLGWHDATGPRQRFAHLTYNTSADRPEITLLDDRPGTEARRLLGAPGAGGLEWADVGASAPSGANEEREGAYRIRIVPGPGGRLDWIEEVGAEGEWVPVIRGSLERVGPPRAGR